MLWCQLPPPELILYEIVLVDLGPVFEIVAVLANALPAIPNVSAAIEAPTTTVFVFNNDVSLTISPPSFI